MTKNLKAARAFSTAHPEVYDLFCKFADEAIASGVKHFSAYAIWERLRWETQIVRRVKHYKLNNNHRPYYARKWLAEHPTYPHFFELRALTQGNMPL